MLVLTLIFLITSTGDGMCTPADEGINPMFSFKPQMLNLTNIGLREYPDLI